MNISTLISNLRDEWLGVFDTPIHLQLAPEDAAPPFCVMRVGEIVKADDDLSERDWQTSITFLSLTTSDTLCLANLDAIVEIFDRQLFDGLYSMTLNSTVFDFNYAENLNLWQSESSFTIRWNTAV